MMTMTIESCLYPKRVTSSGFPPKCFIFCCNHFNAAIWDTLIILITLNVFYRCIHISNARKLTQQSNKLENVKILTPRIRDSSYSSVTEKTG